jgi:dephospho-CoA kinase
MIVGLTGQSGAGKSTVASLFSAEGFRIIDCDRLVHTLYGEARYAKKIADAFGEDFVKDGIVDRKKLGALVFSDKNALEKLNETVHPLILETVLGEMTRARQDDVNAILDAPLLFEYGLEAMCDATLGVICDLETAEKRLSLRDGKSPEEIRGRLAAQHDAAYFRAHCDYILENNGDACLLKQELARVLDMLAVKTD